MWMKNAHRPTVCIAEWPWIICDNCVQWIRRGHWTFLHRYQSIGLTYVSNPSIESAFVRVYVCSLLHSNVYLRSKLFVIYTHLHLRRDRPAHNSISVCSFVFICAIFNLESANLRRQPVQILIYICENGNAADRLVKQKRIEQITSPWMGGKNCLINEI